jgi:hypothetical protein
MKLFSMRNKVFGIILLIMLIMGCVGAKPAVYSGGMDLDTAIREAAMRMEKNLSGGTKVALVSMASSSVQFSEYVINRLEAALVDGGKLVVVDRANLDKVRAEQGFQLSGEVDDDSAKSIGKLLGAGAIVTGSFISIGDMYSLTIKAINIETATVAVSYPADIAKSTRIEALLASGGGAGTGTRTAQTGGGTAATPVQAAPMGPADGTYMFKPRVQAFQGARSVSVYLDRIVVRRGYMTIYIFDTPEGDGSGYGSSLQGSWKTATLTDMENNRPAKLVEVVGNGPPYGSVCEYNLSFQNVSGTRLTLASADRPAIEFYDIVLDQPDY